MRRSVLVVDDEHRIADTLVIILRMNGYTAEAAYDGLEALDRFRELQPDLVLSDVVMPGLNGIEMAISMRGERAGCRVLLFSGQGATANLLEQARTRGHDFELLAKPVHPEVLLARVREMIAPAA